MSQSVLVRVGSVATLLLAHELLPRLILMAAATSVDCTANLAVGPMAWVADRGVNVEQSQTTSRCAIVVVPLLVLALVALSARGVREREVLLVTLVDRVF